jgi:hypothetical protein
MRHLTVNERQLASFQLGVSNQIGFCPSPAQFSVGLPRQITPQTIDGPMVSS